MGELVRPPWAGVWRIIEGAVGGFQPGKQCPPSEGHSVDLCGVGGGGSKKEGGPANYDEALGHINNRIPKLERAMEQRSRIGPPVQSPASPQSDMKPSGLQTHPTHPGGGE